MATKQETKAGQNLFNPFENINKMLGEFDATKVFDPAKVMDQINALTKDFKLPGVDMSAALETQRKNVEALTTANRQALEGMQALLKRQTEIMQETMKEAVDATKDLASGSPQEAASKQAEVVKKAIESALAHMRELAEMSAKSNSEAFSTINQRFTDSLQELKQIAGVK